MCAMIDSLNSGRKAKVNHDRSSLKQVIFT